MAVNFRNPVNFTAGVGIDEVFKAGENLSAQQNRFVQVGTVAGEVVIATGASNPVPLGVLQNAPTASQAARVRMFGITKVIAVAPSGCGIAYGRFIIASDLGQAAPTSSETGGPVMGRWIDTGLAAAASILGKAFINCGGFAVCPVSAS